MDWTKTTVRRDEKHLSFGIKCDLHERFDCLNSLIETHWYACSNLYAALLVAFIDKLDNQVYLYIIPFIKQIEEFCLSAHEIKNKQKEKRNSDPLEG